MVNAKENQSYFDLSLQLFGDVGNVYDLILQNGVESINSKIQLNLAFTGNGNTLLTKYLLKNGLVLNTGEFSEEILDSALTGYTVSTVSTGYTAKTITTGYTYLPHVGQSIFDIALQLHGGIEGIYNIIQDNEIESISGSFGTLKYTNSNTILANYLAINGLTINTAKTNAEDELIRIFNIYFALTFN